MPLDEQQTRAEHLARALEGPAWRQRLASKMISDPRRLPKNIDLSVKEWIQFERIQISAVSGEEDAARQFPVLAAAAGLARDSALFAKFQVMVIAGSARAEIAQRLDCGEAVVEACERFFFDVRPLLSSTDWIAAKVIQPVHNAGDRAHASRLKAAHFGGPVIATAVLNLDAHLPVAKGAALFDRKLKLTLMVDEALAMPLSPGREALRFIKITTEMHVAEKRLELERERLEHQTAQAIREVELKEKKFVDSQQRHQERQQERRSRQEARARRQTGRVADMSAQLDPLLIYAARERQKQEARARAAASPLSRVIWIQPAKPLVMAGGDKISKLKRTTSLRPSLEEIQDFNEANVAQNSALELSGV